MRIIIIATLFFASAWIALGVYLFIGGNWAIGELGDFFGGGIGALTIIILVYTVWDQYKQKAKLEKDFFEANVFRTFEALKPEAENLSVRVIAKIQKSQLIEFSEKSFEEMLTKFRDKGDRTVFLRAMQKKKFKNILTSEKLKDHEAQQAVIRFRNLLLVVENGLKQIEKNSSSEDDFVRAIKSTEIFEAYRVINLS